MWLITCWIYKNYVGKVSPFYPDWQLCYYTKNQVLVPASEFKKKRWMEEADTLNIKFGFSLLIKFSPLYFQKTYHLLNLRGILQQKPMKIMTLLLWYILWSFYASLNICYPQEPAEMFGNVFILMECYLKLSPDVDHSDFTCYVCCFQTVWHCFQTWLVL